jgi:hypothetical protein
MYHVRTFNHLHRSKRLFDTFLEVCEWTKKIASLQKLKLTPLIFKESIVIRELDEISFPYLLKVFNDNTIVKMPVAKEIPLMMEYKILDKASRNRKSNVTDRTLARQKSIKIEEQLKGKHYNDLFGETK